MAKVGINTGTAANAGDGSTLRAGANIVNANFDEIYNYFGDGSNLTFTGGQWVSVNTGINTLSYVGLGTTNPTDPLTVYGGANISGVATASTFSGILSATDAVISGVGSFNNNIFVGAAVSIYGSTGFVSATKYFGDGSALLSVPSGLGTALSEDSNNPLNKMYYVDKVLSIGQTVTVDPPASSQVAFTNYPNIEINSDYDLIIADGDDFIPDILGIGTTGAGSLLGGGRVRADNYVNRSGGAPNFPEGSNSVGITTVGFATATDVWVSGAVTATSFTGDITGTASTATAAANAYGITGKPNVTLDLITADDIVVGGALTVTGNLTVDGTQTIVNTSTLDVADKTVGIASTTAATNTTAAGAGIEIYASSATANNNKTLLWQNTSNCFEFSESVKLKGVSETSINNGSTGVQTYINGTSLVLEIDMELGTVFTYTSPAVAAASDAAGIGIVSFKNMPASSQNIQTVSIIHTQGKGNAGYGNTVATQGIGITCTVVPKANGSMIAGISTRAWCNGGIGAANTVTCSADNGTVSGNVDVISFLVHYTGATNTDLNSYKVYVSANKGFNQGGVGV